MNSVVIDTPVGPVEITECDGAVISIIETTRWPDVAECCDVLALAVGQLGEYFSGRRREFSFPVSPRGTDFQLAVWKEVRQTPYGGRRTYGDIALSLGNPSAVRAVGSAVGKNPLLFVVPCHRIVAAHGPGGFRLGPDAKCALQNLEIR